MQRPDRTPRDFAAGREVWRELLARFGTDRKEDVLVALGIDCRVVSYDCFCTHPDVPSDEELRGKAGGPWMRTEPDGAVRDIWGGLAACASRRIAASTRSSRRSRSRPARASML
ncbi:MAG TPA: hypothetical protein DCM87_06605 [Planctomycetes bacterium]|nr:hypothetical protein [Planctomycetota bacterium]